MHTIFVHVQASYYYFFKHTCILYEYDLTASHHIVHVCSILCVFPTSEVKTNTYTATWGKPCEHQRKVVFWPAQVQDKCKIWPTNHWAPQKPCMFFNSSLVLVELCMLQLTNSQPDYLTCKQVEPVQQYTKKYRKHLLNINEDKENHHMMFVNSKGNPISSSSWTKLI